MCHVANYFDSYKKTDSAVKLHNACTKGGCVCRHQVLGLGKNEASSEER